jgi:oxalate decarboxylase/phosphoglucose isomerase-like protein (cupin superfamily)
MSDEGDHEGRRFVSPGDVDSQVFDWGVLKWMVTPEVNGSERISCGVVKLEPGKGHERHTHPDSDEMLYVVRGEGEQEIADETRALSAGDMLYVPRGVEHGTVNTGWEPLVLVAVYAPPGPEELLASLPECTTVPAGELPTPEAIARYAAGDGSGEADAAGDGSGEADAAGDGD